MAPRERVLAVRLLEFAVGVGRFVKALPADSSGRHLANQLLKSGTAPLAHYAEAREAESWRDYVHKMKMGLKELRETMSWPRYARGSALGDAESASTLATPSSPFTYPASTQPGANAKARTREIERISSLPLSPHPRSPYPRIPVSSHPRILASPHPRIPASWTSPRAFLRVVTLVRRFQSPYDVAAQGPLVLLAHVDDAENGLEPTLFLLFDSDHSTRSGYFLIVRG